MFLDKIIETNNNWSRDLNHPILQKLRSFVEGPEYKRIIFDTNQALLFLDISNEIPNSIEKVQPPFNDFYLEFTKPISIFHPKDENNSEDICRTHGLGYNLEGDLGKITFFETFDEFGDETIFPPVNYFDIKTKKLVIPEHNYHPEHEIYDEISMIQRTKCVNLFHWMCLYMMAKSVNIIEEPVSRQVRRYHERKNTPLPKPWHKIIVDPKVFKNHKPGKHEEGTEHRYRYDVIGHLRIQKRNGIEWVEWVQPHQRGLKNELYIPKTYVVNKGREIAPEKTEKYFKTL